MGGLSLETLMLKTLRLLGELVLRVLDARNDQADRRGYLGR